MEDSIDLGVDIRREDVHVVFKVGDGDRIEFWVVSTLVTCHLSMK